MAKRKHGGKRPGAGRPVTTGPVMLRRQIRASDEQWQRWRAAAAREGLTISAWLRAAGDARAGDPR